MIGLPRRRLLVGVGAGAIALGVGAAWLALGHRRGWDRVPSVTVISATGDPRIGATRAAVAYWNDAFEALPTPFRLGPITEVVGTVPVEELQAASDQVLHGGPAAIPPGARGFPGDLLVALSDVDFISFTCRSDDRVLIGIKSLDRWPLTLPNVVQNVIAHELGHAIGLPHVADPALLMCGRPSDCRPDGFQSDRPRMFPLSDGEKDQLRSMYPPDWSG